jgi:hypothetical protein
MYFLKVKTMARYGMVWHERDGFYEEFLFLLAVRFGMDGMGWDGWMDRDSSALFVYSIYLIRFGEMREGGSI